MDKYYRLNKRVSLIASLILFMLLVFSKDLDIIRPPEKLNPTTVPVSSTPTLGNQIKSATDSARFEEAVVIKVIDGDTIELSNRKKVRYIGIDTPETVDPRRPDGCFGKEASEENKKLVLGKVVRLEKDVSQTDRFGRLLRYVWVGETMVNENLVKEGFAFARTYPPDVKYQKLFQTSEAAARSNQKGLWNNACSYSQADTLEAVSPTVDQ